MGLMDFSLGDVGSLFTGIREAITGKKVVDPAEMERIMLDLAKLENALQAGQIEINKIEAAHKSLFVAGWRPFIGWVCGIAIAYAFVGQPIIQWVLNIYAPDVATPVLDTDTLYQLVLAMLGMATLRTYEKKNNVAREK